MPSWSTVMKESHRSHPSNASYAIGRAILYFNHRCRDANVSPRFVSYTYSMMICLHMTIIQTSCVYWTLLELIKSISGSLPLMFVPTDHSHNHQHACHPIQTVPFRCSRFWNVIIIMCKYAITVILYQFYHMLYLTRFLLTNLYIYLLLM